MPKAPRKILVPVVISNSEVMAWARTYYKTEDVITPLIRLCQNAIEAKMRANPAEGYVGDYWGVTIERPGSSCNWCGDELEIGEFVTAQHYQHSNGTKVKHYFHPPHTPLSGARRRDLGAPPC